MNEFEYKYQYLDNIIRGFILGSVSYDSSSSGRTIFNYTLTQFKYDILKWIQISQTENFHVRPSPELVDITNNLFDIILELRLRGSLIGEIMERKTEIDLNQN